MSNLNYYSIANLPKEFQAFDNNVKQLGVGKSGKVGIIDLELASNSSGKTIVTQQFSQVPLQVQRVFYPEVSIPEMAYLYFLSPSGGMVQGDRYVTNIKLKNKSMAHITTQGATKIYSMNTNCASQIVNITLEENCYLEYIPDQIIPYKNSRYHQNVNLNVHEKSTLIYSEILTSGRLAMGESFDFDLCFLQTCFKDQNKILKFLENTKIEPKKQKLKKFGIFGNKNKVGTIYILTRTKHEELENLINKAMQKFDDVSVGTSILPEESGIIIRILGNETEKIFDMIFKIVEIARGRILGASFSKTRKN